VTWLRIDDSFVDHPKLHALSDAAYRAVTRSWGYAAKHETDGRIPESIAREYTRSSRKVLAELVDCGLWKQNGTGYVIHNFNKRNPTKSDLDARRHADAERMQKWRERNAPSDGDVTP
jgi:hypothetical protein